MSNNRFRDEMKYTPNRPNNRPDRRTLSDRPNRNSNKTYSGNNAIRSKIYAILAAAVLTAGSIGIATYNSAQNTFFNPNSDTSYVQYLEGIDKDKTFLDDVMDRYMEDLENYENSLNLLNSTKDKAELDELKNEIAEKYPDIIKNVILLDLKAKFGDAAGVDPSKIKIIHHSERSDGSRYLRVMNTGTYAADFDDTVIFAGPTDKLPPNLQKEVNALVSANSYKETEGGHIIVTDKGRDTIIREFSEIYKTMADNKELKLDIDSNGKLTESFPKAKDDEGR